MLKAAPASAFGGPGYLSSGYIKTAAILQPATGSSAHGSDLKEAVIKSWMTALTQAQDMLLDWFRDPAALADDDTDALSRDTVGHALTFTRRLKDSLSHLPDNARPLPLLRAVTVGTGGAISMEFAVGSVAMTYVFRADGSAERMIFVENRLHQRDPIALT